MKVVCISDTHRYHGYLNMPKGDILIHAGDFTDWGGFNDIRDFSAWLRTLHYKHKIVIAGNHDVKFETYPEICKAALLVKKNIYYLQNELIDIEGLKIFGCPYTPKFAGAFQLEMPEEDELKYWRKTIPDGIDILITHGPAFGILDSVQRGFDYGFEVEHCGSQGLLERVIEVKPQLHIFGHIHQSYGIIKQRYGITFVNAATQNFETNTMNKPIVVDIHD